MIRVVENTAGAAARITARLDDLLARLKTSARGTRRGDESGAIHDTRVAVRRIEAALDTLRDSLPDDRRRRARKALRGLRRRLGPARELEMAVHGLQARITEAPPETVVAATAALDRLGRRARRGRREAARVAERKVIDRIERRVRRAWRDLAAGQDATGAWIASARTRAEVSASSAMAAFAPALQSIDEVALHDARKALKRWRYRQEWLAELCPQAPRTDPEWLRSVQRALGAIHELAVLRDLLEAYPRKLAEASPRAVSPLRPLIEQVEAERRRELEALCERFAPASFPELPAPPAAGAGIPPRS